jgi:hypothetical protein
MSVAEREDAVQWSVLSLLILAYPAQRSIDEVVSELLGARPDEFNLRDDINNAIRDLAGAKLIHRHGPFVFASRAAVRFDQLSR